MLRLLVLMSLCFVVKSDDFEDFMNEVFGVEPEAAVPTCDGIEGHIRGCYECYQCQDDVIGQHRNRGRPIYQLELKNSTCMTKQVCCVTQIDLLTIRSGDECGKSNPDGQPRRRRKTLRSVLEGEYPWRAWVYRKGNPHPICAATYINENTRALITLASCVEDLPAELLEVAFVKGSYGSAVNNVIVHDEYDPETDKNDIAILRLYSLSYAPKWAFPACLPAIQPIHGLPCITISDDEKYIDTIIPLKSTCANKNTICAIAPHGDYSPETGAGLYCKEQSITVPSYIIYGLAISDHGSTTSYTNVALFTNWIDDKLLIK